MGNVKKQRKKYKLPFKKWDKTRADSEDSLVTEFGLANKKEVWKANAKVSKMRATAKNLFARSGAVAERTKKEVLDKAKKLGLLSVESPTLDDILGLTTRDILGRRLQTIIVKKGFTGGYKQARQFITHGHVIIGDRTVTIPGYLVTKEEEGLVSILPRSPLSKSDHPARMTPQMREDARLLDKLKKKKKEGEEEEGAVEEKDVAEVEHTPEDE